DADLALAMVRRVQSELRPELNILVMSATLAAEPIAHYLGNCPAVTSEGRMFPVDIRYQKHERPESLHQRVAEAVEALLAEVAGDVLVFLPGIREIRQTADALSAVAA